MPARSLPAMRRLSLTAHTHHSHPHRTDAPTTTHCSKNVAFVRHRRGSSVWLLVVVSVMVGAGLLATAREEVQGVLQLTIHGMNNAVHRTRRSIEQHTVNQEQHLLSAATEANLTSDQHRPAAKEHHNKKQKRKQHKGKHPKEKAASSPHLPVLTAEFSGKLGEDMFRYATLLGVANVTNHRPVLPHGVVLREIFNLTTPAADLSRIKKLTDYRVIGNASQAQHKQMITAGGKQHACLVGPLLSWKFFHDIKQLLTLEYKLPPKALETGRAVIERALSGKPATSPAMHKHTNVSKTTTVGVYLGHISVSRSTRRTDGYLMRAVRYFNERFHNVYCLVLCFEVRRCRKIIPHKLPCTHSVVKLTDHITTVSILSHLHHVIYHATDHVGWWGAWLSQGIVTYDRDKTEVDVPWSVDGQNKRPKPNHHLRQQSGGVPGVGGGGGAGNPIVNVMTSDYMWPSWIPL